MKSNRLRTLAVIAAILAAGLLVGALLVAGRRVATLYAFAWLIACAGVPLALLGGLTWFTTWRRGEHHLFGPAVLAAGLAMLGQFTAVFIGVEYNLREVDDARAYCRAVAQGSAAGTPPPVLLTAPGGCTLPTGEIGFYEPTPFLATFRHVYDPAADQWYITE